MRDDKAVEILVGIFKQAFSPETNRERALMQLQDEERERAIKIVLDMANRYDEDIEGCDGEQLIGYDEAIACCHRLAYVIKHGLYPESEKRTELRKSNEQKLVESAKQLYKEPLTWPI